jgi:hypothetical protein
VRRIVLLALFLATTASAAPPNRPEVESWREDLRVQLRELPNRHPAPFLHVTRAEWDSAGASLDKRLPTLSRDQRLVEFMRLVALIGDAHTNLEPDSSLGLRFYPLELYSFDDGLFVRPSLPTCLRHRAHGSLV